jgi:hypothetical protein
VKSKAGYFEDNDSSKRILGVGYTDVGTLPPEAAGREHSYIVSAEWTFGAINMCLVLAEQYAAQGNTDYTASLRKDAESMMRAMREMMLDKESRSDDTEAYFYSNIRYEIPFGWFGNRIDSLCSTAWAIMMENRFNPFVLGGSLDGTAGRSGISPKASQPLLQLKKLRLDLSQIEEPSP